jgi:hypothetical protein
VEKRSKITEEDILLTEALIAVSYNRLKKSVVQAPFKAISSLGEGMMKHPIETAAAAGGAGIGMYGLFKLMNQKGAGREKIVYCREGPSQPDMRMEVLSTLIPIITPYLTACLEKCMGSMGPGDRD